MNILGKSFDRIGVHMVLISMQTSVAINHYTPRFYLPISISGFSLKTTVPNLVAKFGVGPTILVFKLNH